MAANSTVKTTFNKKWSLQVTTGLERGLLELVSDIQQRSDILAPIDSGALVNSSRIDKLGSLAYAITYGSGRVPYARRQFFENKTHSRWLEKAADSVTRSNTDKYFKNKGI